MSKPEVASIPKQKVGKGRDDFRALHDKSFIVPAKIRAAIAKLGKSGWEYEQQFMKLAELSTTDLAAHRDQFEDHIVTVGGRNPKRCWCGSKELATELRTMV